MTETEAAWLAGFLDGEGSFMILRSERYGYESWHALIAAASTDPALIERCKVLAGGKSSSRAKPRGNAKGSSMWQLSGRGIDAVLPRILPYLVGKREQAELVMLFRKDIRPGASPGNFGRFTTPDVIKGRRDQMRLAIQALNHRGTTPIPSERLDALSAVRAAMGQRSEAIAEQVAS